MTYRKMNNGDYVIQAKRLWKDDNGLECSGRISFLISSVVSIEESVTVSEWTHPPGSWLNMNNIDPGVSGMYVDIPYDEIRDLWLNYLENGLKMLNYIKN